MFTIPAASPTLKHAFSHARGFPFPPSTASRASHALPRLVIGSPLPSPSHHTPGGALHASHMLVTPPLRTPPVNGMTPLMLRESLQFPFPTNVQAVPATEVEQIDDMAGASAAKVQGCLKNSAKRTSKFYKSSAIDRRHAAFNIDIPLPAIASTVGQVANALTILNIMSVIKRTRFEIDGHGKDGDWSSCKDRVPTPYPELVRKEWLVASDAKENGKAEAKSWKSCRDRAPTPYVEKAAFLGA